PRRDPQRAPGASRRLGRGHPDDAQRLGVAGRRWQGDRRHRHPARHAGLRARRARPAGVAGGAAAEDPRPREVRGSGRGPRAQDDRPGEGGGIAPPPARTDEGGKEPDVTVPGPTNGADQEPPTAPSIERLVESEPRLLEYVRRLEQRVREGEDRRWALLHILTDMNRLNQRLARQREAMLHIL